MGKADKRGNKQWIVRDFVEKVVISMMTDAGACLERNVLLPMITLTVPHSSCRPPEGRTQWKIGG